MPVCLIRARHGGDGEGGGHGGSRGATPLWRGGGEGPVIPVRWINRADSKLLPNPHPHPPVPLAQGQPFVLLWVGATQGPCSIPPPHTLIEKTNESFSARYSASIHQS